MLASTLAFSQVRRAFREPGDPGYGQSWLERMAVFVSDDESSFDRSETSPNPAGGRMEALSPAGDPDTSRSFVVTRIWSAPCADLSEMPYARRVVDMIDDTLGIVAVLQGRLALGSAQRFEVMLGARGSHRRQLRDRYSLPGSGRRRGRTPCSARVRAGRNAGSERMRTGVSAMLADADVSPMSWARSVDPVPGPDTRPEVCSAEFGFTGVKSPVCGRAPPAPVLARASAHLLARRRLVGRPRSFVSELLARSIRGIMPSPCGC